MEQFEIEMAYNSNAIEGNSLTLKETYWVIREGITIKDKPLKDHLEAKNQHEALDYLYELVEHGKKNTISEVLIKQLHALVVRDTERDVAGKYREGDVIIAGSNHRPPGHTEVSPEMRELVSWLVDNRKKYHVVELAALLHHKLVFIHPFWDGNGRMARLAMNIQIMEAGYPLAIILKNDRKRYYRVLGEADEGRYGPLCEFVAQAVIRSLNIYLSTIAPTRKKDEKYVSLKVLATQSTYSPAYLRKLATQGKLESFKEGRNWLSSKRALREYMESRKRIRG
ncbi:MAG: Fic family protein [Thermoleophilia bacterium]